MFTIRVGLRGALQPRLLSTIVMKIKVFPKSKCNFSWPFLFAVSHLFNKKGFCMIGKIMQITYVFFFLQMGKCAKNFGCKVLWSSFFYEPLALLIFHYM